MIFIAIGDGFFQFAVNFEDDLYLFVPAQNGPVATSLIGLVHQFGFGIEKKEQTNKIKYGIRWHWMI